MLCLQEIPVYMRPLMIWMCSRQAGETKSFRDVGGCMEAVKALCFQQCQDSEEDRDYRECVADAAVIAAYRFSEVRLLSFLSLDCSETFLVPETTLMSDVRVAERFFSKR